MADRGQAGPAQTGSALKPSRKGGGATRAAGAPGQGKRKRDAKKSVGFSNKQDVFEIPARQAKRAKQPAQRKAESSHAMLDDLDDSEEEEDASSRNVGYSMDSDDEDGEVEGIKKSKYRITEDDEHEALDSEFVDGGVKVTGFNIDEELEDGHFDEDGNYHKHTDKLAEADAWLDGLDTFVPKAQAKPVEVVEEKEFVHRPRLDLVKDIVALMQPKESVAQSLRRLGGSQTQTRRWQNQKKNKRKNEPKDDKDSGAPSADRKQNDELMKRLTGYTDELLGGGDYEIYQATYEKLTHELKTAIKKQEEGAASAEAPAEAPAAAPAPSGPMFEYKWNKDEGGELFGPFTAQQMLDWSAQGFFKTPVQCRQVGKPTFYASNRVEFDDYI